MEHQKSVDLSISIASQKVELFITPGMISLKVCLRAEWGGVESITEIWQNILVKFHVS